MGQVMPVLGRDWSQEGVVDLFTKIQSNGYKMVYLSSRPIGQSGRTRNFLENQVVQDINGISTKLPRGRSKLFKIIPILKFSYCA
jgi:phosphatidate phosphatase PAH1